MMTALAFNELISSKLESLSKEQLDERLNFLVNEEKLKNKPHNGKNSYDMETICSLLLKRPSNTDHRQPRH